MTNAVKFTEAGTIVFTADYKDGTLSLEISDTGIGIEADKLSKVFERFVKVNNYAQGTGLGLSICKTIF